MAVLGTGIDVKVAKEFRSEARLGKHTANGLLYNARWVLGKLLSRSTEPLATGIASVADVLFVVHLFTRQGHFGCIDNNYVISAVHVRGVVGLVLTAKAEGDMRGQSTKGETLGVNHDPGLTCVCLSG